jgi:GT2 family glycosyltransferase
VSVDASIVIVNWNGRRYLGPCLDAVHAQAGVTHETILVDNGSEDGSAALVRERYPWVRVVALDENRGFAGGNNAGAAVARGRELVFLNNDTEVEPGWLQALCAGVDERAGVLLASSRVVYMHDPGVLDSAGDGLLRWGGAFKWHHGAPVDAAPDSREVFGVCGAACLVRRAVFVELDGFDEAFFASHEDVDLSYRARLRGYRCRYVADAVVRHHGSATLGRQSAFAVFHGQRNLEWMYVKDTPGALLARTLPGHAVYTAAAALHFARAGHLGAFLRAKAAALAGLPRVWRQRRAVQGARTVPAEAIAAHLEADWLGVKRREKRFDRELAG